MADGAQKNGVEFLELFQRTVGKNFAGTLVALTGFFNAGCEIGSRCRLFVVATSAGNFL